MSSSSRSYLVAGVVRPRTSFDIRSKTFDHDYPEDWTHDPKSGRELWKTENQLGEIEHELLKTYGISIVYSDWASPDIVLGVMILKVGSRGSSRDENGMDCLEPYLDIETTLEHASRRLTQAGIQHRPEEVLVHLVNYFS